MGDRIYLLIYLGREIENDACQKCLTYKAYV